MNIDYLKEFVALANSASFTQAARALGISQPALSKHIKILEDDLRTRLFDRGGQELQLTPLGRFFLDRVGSILMEYDDLRVQMRELRKEKPEQLHVATFFGYLRIDNALRVAVKELKCAHPLLDVKVSQIISDDVLDEVRAGTIDLAVLPLRFEEQLKGLEVCRLYPEPLIALVPQGSELACRESVRVNDLAGQTVRVAARPDFQRFKKTVERLLIESGGSANVQNLLWSDYESLNLFDFSEGVYIGCRFATLDNMPEQIRRRYKVLPFEEESMFFWAAAVWRCGCESKMVPVLARLLQEGLGT